MANNMRTMYAYARAFAGISNRSFKYLYATSISRGNERQTPTRGKYKRCSKMTSRMGTMLDVGANVKKNQNIENAKTGCLRRMNQPNTRIEHRKTIDAMTAGSKMLLDGGKS